MLFPAADLRADPLPSRAELVGEKRRLKGRLADLRRQLQEAGRRTRWRESRPGPCDRATVFSSLGTRLLFKSGIWYCCCPLLHLVPPSPAGEGGLGTRLLIMSGIWHCFCPLLHLVPHSPAGGADFGGFQTQVKDSDFKSADPLPGKT